MSSEKLYVYQGELDVGDGTKLRVEKLIVRGDGVEFVITGSDASDFEYSISANGKESDELYSLNYKDPEITAELDDEHYAVVSFEFIEQTPDKKRCNVIGEFAYVYPDDYTRSFDGMYWKADNKSYFDGELKLVAPERQATKKKSTATKRATKKRK